MNIPKFEFIDYIYILNIENIFDLGSKTFFKF